ALTDAMLHSGTVLDLSDIPGLKVDKHSTGGVGDKISIVLAPLVAECGVPVPMISGRSLGHSGGTLDKLESIPGFDVNLSLNQYRELLHKHRMVLIGQTKEIAPADKKLYALRDVTATVECIPLIAGSIMSKKMAEGIDALVLDVKCGQGAFMREESDARRLAETLAGIGERLGKPTVAWLTNMNAPLGYAVGNWSETAEAIRCLHGEYVPELNELTCQLAGEMLWLGGVAESPEAGVEQAEHVLASGAALGRFAQLVDAQGGDSSVVQDPSRYPDFEPAGELRAPEHASGVVTGIDAFAIGLLSTDMGSGRVRAEDDVDPRAGLVLAKKPGDAVQPGDLLATLYTERTGRIEEFTTRGVEAFTFGAEATAEPLLMDRYFQGHWQNG
ncbi:MAG: thymidine phosphorylase, partial [Bacteroidota bacterium]